MTGTINRNSEWEKIQWNCNGIPLPGLIRFESDNEGSMIRFGSDGKLNDFLEKEWLDSLDNDGVISSD
jgi:hypothetical protein